MRVKKSDEELQIVWGEVYAPGLPDSQGDFMSAETIRKMAHDFMANMRVGQIDTNHNNELVDAVVVESFIARDGDPVFIPGSWVAGVHIRDADTWEAVKKGEFNGFSVEASAKGRDVEIEIEVPEYVDGETSEVDGHTHKFRVFFDEEGNFLGGVTDDEQDHQHEIIKGTVTEKAKGHTHRFSFYEVFLNGES